MQDADGLFCPSVNFSPCTTSCGSREARKMASVRQIKQLQICAVVVVVIIALTGRSTASLIQTNCFLQVTRVTTVDGNDDGDYLYMAKSSTLPQSDSAG